MSHTVPNRSYPTDVSIRPTETFSTSLYSLRFAESAEDLEAVQRLRYEVFNLELNEGLKESTGTQRDADAYDLGCHHLMVSELKTGSVVGTYRMQTLEMAEAHIGFYSASEFDLSALPPDVLSQSVELGRTCIARSHRNGRVLFLLWRGICLYLLKNAKRYFFGCCSLSSQDPVEGNMLMEYFRENGHVHAGICINPKPGYACIRSPQDDDQLVVQVPIMAQLNMNYGAKVCSFPAMDRAFRTIDYLMLFDMESADPKSRRRFIGDAKA